MLYTWLRSSGSPVSRALRKALRPPSYLASSSRVNTRSSLDAMTLGNVSSSQFDRVAFQCVQQAVRGSMGVALLALLRRAAIPLALIYCLE